MAAFKLLTLLLLLTASIGKHQLLENVIAQVMNASALPSLKLLDEHVLTLVICKVVIERAHLILALLHAQSVISVVPGTIGADAKQLLITPDQPAVDEN